MHLPGVNTLPARYHENKAWFLEHIPFFDCPDLAFQETYYFRWDVYRKHIRHTSDGYIITEFSPDVPWAGKHNSISAASSHHIYDGRWLRKNVYLHDYIRFWFENPEAAPRAYSCWIADAVYAYYLTTGRSDLPLSLLTAMVENYKSWEQERADQSGLFWQVDDRDGMEFQISGSGYRPTLNSYLYGDALAIAHLAELAQNKALAATYYMKAAHLKAQIQDRLWDREAQFFKTLPVEVALHQQQMSYKERALPPHQEPGRLADVRELQGYIPWYFNLPDPGYERAWLQLRDPQGFAAPYGPSTAERRHPYWQAGPELHQHDCLWRGSSWPFATSQVLTALANLLNNYNQQTMTVHDYFTVLQNYTRLHQIQLAEGRLEPWIDESANPDTGEWVTRSILYAQHNPLKDRGRDYNHSTYMDHIISGLIGLRPRADTLIEINPLLPAETWSYFCLQEIPYHDHLLTILYDKDGSQYGQGPGLHLYVDQQHVGSRPDHGPLMASL